MLYSLLTLLNCDLTEGLSQLHFCLVSFSINNCFNSHFLEPVFDLSKDVLNAISIWVIAGIGKALISLPWSYKVGCHFACVHSQLVPI